MENPYKTSFYRRELEINFDFTTFKCSQKSSILASFLVSSIYLTFKNHLEIQKRY
jgi:hypothetical protein